MKESLFATLCSTLSHATLPVMKSTIGTHEKNEPSHEENGSVSRSENSNHKSETSHEENGPVIQSENSNLKSEISHEENGSVSQSENSNEESGEEKGL